MVASSENVDAMKKAMNALNNSPVVTDKSAQVLNFQVQM